ncbi:hypothetical protein THASP1DRAFT_27498 [Thamnocephalis sphaerospora]|uniref:Arrestin C-terminal-like domain-containing protein n=1 Tax=Thamnocephalis sphaerospora TaxID=78915 RepID=A0A4P9XZ27_9FUNG|nr:hypothetical protein THASP1DRAFT_27498 [Thamnocephalis sphaerospora]|eukprot:RKP10700.1 hypothetical protein THASP1DRAFT_27498 [Thamnocephalis sphaerospora]
MGPRITFEPEPDDEGDIALDQETASDDELQRHETRGHTLAHLPRRHDRSASQPLLTTIHRHFDHILTPQPDSWSSYAGESGNARTSDSRDGNGNNDDDNDDDADDGVEDDGSAGNDGAEDSERREVAGRRRIAESRARLSASPYHHPRGTQSAINLGAVALQSGNTRRGHYNERLVRGMLGRTPTAVCGRIRITWDGRQPPRQRRRNASTSTADAHSLCWPESVTVCLRGILKTTWSYTMEFRFVSGVKQKVLDVSQVVWQHKDSGQATDQPRPQFDEETQTYTLLIPFYIPLPGTLPSSYQTSHAYIKYTLSATLRHNMRGFLPFPVTLSTSASREVMLRRWADNAQSRWHQRVVRESTASQAARLGYAYTVYMPRAGFGPGDTIVAEVCVGPGRSSLPASAIYVVAGTASPDASQGMSAVGSSTQRNRGSYERQRAAETERRNRRKSLASAYRQQQRPTLASVLEQIVSARTDSSAAAQVPSEPPQYPPSPAPTHSHPSVHARSTSQPLLTITTTPPLDVAPAGSGASPTSTASPDRPNSAPTYTTTGPLVSPISPTSLASNDPLYSFSDISLRKVTLVLKRRERIVRQPHVVEKTSICRTVDGSPTHNAADNLFHRVITLPVPHNLPPTLAMSNVAVSYTLHIRLSMRNASDTEIEVPVKVMAVSRTERRAEMRHRHSIAVINPATPYPGSGGDDGLPIEHPPPPPYRPPPPLSPPPPPFQV